MSLPLVTIVSTGGTIAGEGESPTAVNYTISDINANKLAGSIAGVETIARIRSRDVCNKASQDLTDTDLLEIGRIVKDELDDPEVSGVVVTHGTNTLEETAFFLSLVASSKKPVVVTGAMRPASAIGADGPGNLLSAVRYCVSDQADYGVVCIFNEVIYSAAEVCKTDGNIIDAFDSPFWGALGFMHKGVPVIRRPQKKLTIDLESVLDHITLPKVDFVYFGLGADPQLLAAAAESKTEGIIVAGGGSGNVSESFLKQMRKISESGIPILRASRLSQSGVFSSMGEDENHSYLHSGWLNPAKARILLQVLLALGYKGKRLEHAIEKVAFS